MSKNLDVMTFGDWVWGGSTGYARYEFSDDFVDENGVSYSGPSAYLEVATTISGHVVTIPAYPNFPETEAAVLNNGVTVTCHLLDSNRVKKAILFDSVRVYTSLPSTVSLSQLVLANGASRLLRDTDVWTKEQVIDYVETRPPAAKMTALAFGSGRLSTAASDPADPVVASVTDPRFTNSGRLAHADHFDFSATGVGAVSTIGVRDPLTVRPTVGQTVAGADAITTYTVRFTYTNAAGETLPSPIAAIVVSANKRLVVTSPPAAQNATGWNVYIAKADSGHGFGTERKQNGGTPIAIGTDFTLSSYSATVAAPPTSNTTGTTAVTIDGTAYLYSPVDNNPNDTTEQFVWQPLLIDEGTAQEEIVYVLSATATTFTAAFTKTHSAGFSVKSATNGIQEASMSLPGWSTGRGGTVMLPVGVSTNKAPVILRGDVMYDGGGGSQPNGDLGGFKSGAIIRFTSTDEHWGAFVTTYFLGIESVVMRGVTVWSDTHAILSLGILGGTGEFRFEQCNLRAGYTGTRNRSAVRSHYGQGRVYTTHSLLSGDPVYHVTGGFCNQSKIESSALFLSNGDASYQSRGIVIKANAGDDFGLAGGGGLLTLSDVLFELGTGSLIDTQDMTIRGEHIDIADWAPAAGAIGIKYNVHAVVGQPYLDLWDVQFPNTPSGASLDLSQDVAGGLRYIHLRDIVFNPQAVAIDAHSITGPIHVEHCRNVSRATSGNGAIANLTAGTLMFGPGNFAAGSNDPAADMVFDTLNGLSFGGLRGLSSTTTLAKNLGGTVTLAAGTATVAFATAEPDANYRIVGLEGNAAEKFSWASKTVNGFTINSDNGASTAIVDWMIVRT